VKDIETALLMMREHGIDQVLVVNADTATLDTANAVTITRAAVELDEDIGALVCAIIARHDPERLAAMAPVLVVRCSARSGPRIRGGWTRSARRSAASSSRSRSASVMVQLGRDLLDVRRRQQGRWQREPHRVDQLPQETTRVIGQTAAESK
jgi:hypothetical protein